MEWKFSKDQILELYLNKVYFGGGSYGIDAASRRFFGHSATQLSLSEAAIIAGLVKAPSRYSPTADAKAAIGRAGVVLAVMQDVGVITPAEAAAASPQAVKLAAQPPQNSARYFTDWALPQLDSLIDETSKPIDVWTTLDVKMQAAATSAIVTSVPAGVQGALVSIDRDGAVRAMVGGTDYVTSNYNRATIATRQPGSSWKIFVYMAAIEAGYKLTDKVVDEPIDIGGWQPKNSSGRFSGEMNIRSAFANSVNTVAAKLGRDVGTASIANMARRFGVNTPINTSPSMVLGTSEVRLIDMTRAVAGIARKGAPVIPFAISKVTTAEGAVLYARKAESMPTVIEPWVAAGITDLMQTAVVTGTGRAAQIGRPVAGKTGTTNSNRDGYFVGFSSGLTTGVWMGRDDNKAVGGLQGGRAPATAFSKFMRVAVSGRPVEQFETNVTPPDWVLEGTEGAEFGEPGQGPLVDENGMPIELPSDAPSDPASPDPQTLDDKWLDEITGGGNADGPAQDDPPKQRPGNQQPKATPPKQSEDGEVIIQ
jgi:penicillin-binding protein 1A